RSADCAVHSRRTGTPSTPPTAHSTCGHSAPGAEWTYSTPRVLLIVPPRLEMCLPRQTSSHRNNCAHCAPPAPIAPPRRISGDFTTFGVAPRASMGGGVGEDGVMTTDTHRSVDLDRTERGRYRASNVRGGQLVIGDGSTDDFTPVEL